MSELSEIRRQFHNGNWKKFVNSVAIDKLRGWDGTAINFRFPICAIVGENGSGKSTILRAVASAYETKPKPFYPGKMFLNSAWDTASVPPSSLISYKITEGENRTIEGKWKRTTEWAYSPKGKRPVRHVAFLDISRTLPLDATAGYAKIAKLSAHESINGFQAVEIRAELMASYSHIMGSNDTTGRFVTHNKKDIGLISRSGNEISQFHQGAGEDALLDLMLLLQTIPDQALLILDEIEASFHPKAQRRLIKFLTEPVRKKKLQVILSTHSPYILEELPPESRILVQKLHDGSRVVQYGISTNYAMGVIDEDLHPDLHIYVEDREARILLLEILKKDEQVFSRVEVKEVGDAEAVKTLGRLCRNNKLPTKGIAVLDGDAGKDVNDNCLYLPTNSRAPEKAVFSDLKKIEWNDLDMRFGMGAGNLYSIFDDALTSPDHHEITTLIGDRVRKNKNHVWSIFVEEWCKQCLDPAAAEELTSKIKEALNEL